MAMTEENETLLVDVINALYRRCFNGDHLDEWLATPATEQISSEGLKAAIDIIDFLVPLTKLCDSMMNLSIQDVGHNLNPDDFAVLVKYIFNTGLPLPDEWKQDLINATVGLVPEETKEDNLISYWLCKICKVTPTECWTHAPIDECIDIVCIKEKHGAICMSCQNDMLQFNSELNLRNN